MAASMPQLSISCAKKQANMGLKSLNVANLLKTKFQGEFQISQIP